MNETLLITLIAITIAFPITYRLIKNRKKIKILDIKIMQKKEDKNLVDAYDCRARHYAEIIDGYACQHIPDNAKEWLDVEKRYLNENCSEYLKARERLYGNNYVLGF